jgi:hypothetical protein
MTLLTAPNQSLVNGYLGAYRATGKYFAQNKNLRKRSNEVCKPFPHGPPENRSVRILFSQSLIYRELSMDMEKIIRESIKPLTREEIIRFWAAWVFGISAIFFIAVDIIFRLAFHC